MFIARMDRAIELFVVQSSFVRMSPILYALFARLNALSTATLSALSMYSSFLSALGSFFGLPSEGPESLMPCSLQYLRLLRLRYILSASALSGYLPVRSLYFSIASMRTSLSLYASNESFSILPSQFSSRLRSNFAPNSTGDAAFPLTIGLIYGWLMLTILSGTECTLLSYMCFCCS